LAVRPEVDGGRYPAKCVMGDVVAVEAELVADGHEIVRAALLHRPPGETTWSEVELVPAGNDVWNASFVAGRIGRHHFTVTAWLDAFASWRRGLERKVAAGNDVSVELLEGAILVDEAADRAKDEILRA
jgi:starch synthase (maltosyl-transferring)